MASRATAVRKRHTPGVGLPARRCFTAEEYQRMIRRHVLAPDERTELIEGDVIRMAAIGSHHFQCVNTFTAWLVPAVGDRGIVSVQSTIRLSANTMPEPDLVVLRWRDDGYSGALPGPGDILLLIEVSESSFPFDQKRKLPLYAAAGVPELWITQVAKQQVLVHRTPVGAAYENVQTIGRDGSLSPHAFPDLHFPVAGLFKWGG